MEMKVPADMIGAIVGKGGSNIMAIQDATGCFINTNKPQSGGGGRGGKGGSASVTIKGPAKGVKEARAMIEDMMSTNSKDTETIAYDPNLRLFLIRPPKDDPSGLCPLEKIKRESNCFRVDAPRGESVIHVTGKKENKEAAVKMLKELLQSNTRDVVKISFPSVLFGVIGVREDGKDSVVDGIKKECGAESVSVDKQGGIITVVGDATSSASTAAKIKELVASMEGDIETVSLTNERAIPMIIGTGGSSINRLRRDTGTEINLDRDTMTATVYGPATGRASAISTIKKILEEMQQ
jgi:polyribonucleotide nucleotidyltransferase